MVFGIMLQVACTVGVEAAGWACRSCFLLPMWVNSCYFHPSQRNNKPETALMTWLCFVFTKHWKFLLLLINRAFLYSVEPFWSWFRPTLHLLNDSFPVILLQTAASAYLFWHVGECVDIPPPPSSVCITLHFYEASAVWPQIKHPIPTVFSGDF